MSTLINTPQLNNIYQSLSFLNLVELDQVMQEVINLRRKKLPSVLSQQETELLKKINISVPKTVQKRYNSLINKKNLETINQSEYQELLELTSYMENFNVKRLEKLAVFGRLKNLSLDEVVEQLQLKPKMYVA